MGVWYSKDPWKIVTKPVLDANGNPENNSDGTPKTKEVKELDAVYPFISLKEWIKPNDYYYPLLNFTPSQTLMQNLTTTCPINANTSTWVANGQALRVVRFLGGTANNSTTHPYTATYRTDSTGRFDFIIEYPKANAQWVSVEVGAKTTLAQTPTRGYTTLTLPSLASDYATDGSYAPNRVSPYTTCTN